MTIVKKTTQEQKEMLVTILAKRLINLEFQINNPKSITKEELATARKEYKLDQTSLMKLILAKAKEMNYPEMKDWPDTAPMEAISKLSNNMIARTEAYQAILGLIITL